MNLIQCASNCIYQKDGYCGLETTAQVNSIKGECPHYKPFIKSNKHAKLSDKRKRFINAFNTDKPH